jgi:GNAT superfamily N-acetyltransferase
MEIEIRKMKADDCRMISEAFSAQGWNKPEKQYRSYLDEQNADERGVLLAFLDNQFAGYLTIKWDSYYPPFREKNIPEIMDLNVLIKFRNNGIATRLMDQAERIVSKRSDSIGIGVGLTAGYGNAQALYVKRGYLPDRNGISYNETFPKYGDTVKVDDDLILCFIKRLV